MKPDKQIELEIINEIDRLNTLQLNKNTSFFMKLVIFQGPTGSSGMDGVDGIQGSPGVQGPRVSLKLITP